MTYHLAKTLRTWGQKQLANKLNDAGRKLLSQDGGEKTSNAEIPEGMPEDDGEEGGRSFENVR